LLNVADVMEVPAQKLTANATDNAVSNRRPRWERAERIASLNMVVMVVGFGTLAVHRRNEVHHPQG
jgi:hypothetical protein